MAVTKLIQSMISGATAFGLSLLNLADAAAARALLGLTGLQDATAFGISVLSAANQAAAQTILGIISPVYGNWTPALTINNSATGITYTTQLGRYVKIGRLVIASGFCVLSSKGASTGIVRAAGLPFTSDSAASIFPLVIANLTSFASLFGGTISGLITSNDTTAVLYNGSATGSTLLLDTNVTNTSDLRFTAIYLTA